MNCEQAKDHGICEASLLDMMWSHHAGDGIRVVFKQHLLVT